MTHSLDHYRCRAEVIVVEDEESYKMESNPTSTHDKFNSIVNRGLRRSGTPGVGLESQVYSLQDYGRCEGGVESTNDEDASPSWEK